jgi:hypothetical protein
MAGCGINMEYFTKPNNRVSHEWLRNFKLNQTLTTQALGHREALKYMEQNDCQFITEWEK